ncbi:LLM class F420-dependent oxidoreductase [Luteipulveratus mongoliensis]|uniref:5,10-methylene tetrahydromethanopterin reductase n=1 Tax=Luteipulveratus mongoliensis TaxID=571913 RepID=A0A0K1JG87_9MICO|nr:LLM class F420-dependent oxidoreductase [Luteipulveratus mongoliensis]AKU15613.1 5,10-methylene tetrahydromethanopterin reductase [Luteipulveratus mongoliensis]
MSIRLGYQIPNFTYPGERPDAIFPTVAAQAREAEAAGFDTVLVMDHFYQLAMIGKPEEPMLESYTALAAIAGATESVQLSTLVTGVTYRNPAHLAKTVTTLDVISGGRAVLGLGAGWFELEHDEMGYEFGTFTDRFERLEEGLQIIQPMLRGENPTFKGKWYAVNGVRNEPRLRDDLPIMLGGSGEKKTFRLAAQYADHLNIICGPDELPRKLEALDQRCAEVGRDRSTLETSYLATVFTDPDGNRAREVAVAHAGKLGLDPAAFTDGGRLFIGTPDEVAGQIKEKVIDVGVDSIVINLIGNGHEPGIITAAGEALKPLVF